MRRSVSPICLVAASALWLCSLASEASGPTNAPAAAPPELPPQLLRDPFWPVGWAPQNFGQSGTDEDDRNATARWEEARKLLQVTGLSRGVNGKFVAILKGIGVVQEGQTVSVNHGDLTYRWRIASINSRGIVPEKVGASPAK